MNAGARHRGLVIFAVFVLVVICSLVATTMIGTARSARDAAQAWAGAAESRAAALSGLHALALSFERQRDQLLAGEDPELDRSWEIAELEGGARLVARLLPESDDPARSLAALVDANAADPERLAALLGADTGQPDAPAAAAIARARPFLSPGELARVEGLPADRAALLGVFAYEPEVSAGAGREETLGAPRLNLGADWSDDLAESIDQRWGDGAADFVRAQRASGVDFDSYDDFLFVLNAAAVPQDRWPEVLDSVTTAPNDLVAGRIDLNRAPADALATVPGIDPAAGEAIVGARAGLTADQRRSIVWPLTQGLLDPEDWSRAAPHLTARTLQWLVRIEAGRLPTAREGASGAELRDAAAAGRLEHPVVIEAVIDAAGPRARIAYLREVTALAAMSAIHAERAGPGAPPSDPASDAPPEPEPVPDAAAPASNASPRVPPAPTDPRVGRWRGAEGAP